ncbi:MAG: hypothetical protein ACR2PG_20420 [Hyphomicrobiaceae bacterium]
MKNIFETPIWAPSDEELRAIEGQVRAERRKAITSAGTFMARKMMARKMHDGRRLIARADDTQDSD